jgi:alkylation response protein AidB-like acyl-CoA dehydrogenase
VTDFLTDAQRDVQVLAREFAAGEIAPRSAEWNRRHEVPVELFRQMGDLGLLGIAVPEEYGGTDLDHVSYCLAVEAIAAADAGVSTGVAAHTGLAIPPLVRWGTDAQKGRWLPALVAGETIGAYALSEAEAGSDPASMRMSAKAIERGYVLDGAKQWITNAGIASFFVVFARTGEPGPRGISAFGIEPGPGLRVGAEIEKMGQHSSSTAEIAFEQMEAPVEALLGGEGEGLELALDTLGASRIAVAA